MTHAISDSYSPLILGPVLLMQYLLYNVTQCASPCRPIFSLFSSLVFSALVSGTTYFTAESPSQLSTVLLLQLTLSPVTVGQLGTNKTLPAQQNPPTHHKLMY